VSTSPTFIKQLFHKYFWAKKIQSQNVTREKLREALLYKKISNIMLMKWTLGVNFTNILQAAFVQISFCQKITKQSQKIAEKTLLLKITPCKMLLKFYDR